LSKTAMRWMSKSTSQVPKTFAVSSSMSSLWNCAASSACWPCAHAL
jgi:hypothetical protein